jgi:hypothetical protein
MASMPIPPRISPTMAIISAFTMDPLLRYVRTVMPTIIMEKYSGGPNCKATPDKRGPIIVKAITPNVPAMKEPKAAIPKAGPALPFRAILCPSIQVTTDAASPGMFTRMEVVDPPYMAP